MITIPPFVRRFNDSPFRHISLPPWSLVAQLSAFLLKYLTELDTDYMRQDNVLIHRSARVEPGVRLKGPIVIGPNCFIGAHAYLRAGVYLDQQVNIGPGCEIKSSLFFENSSAAHFNFIGDSVIGSEVNFEAGAITANHYNERQDKRIFIQRNGQSKDTGAVKFGALIGDGCKIGANAVLSPGTILEPNTTVGRLELVQQNP